MTTPPLAASMPDKLTYDPLTDEMVGSPEAVLALKAGHFARQAEAHDERGRELQERASKCFGYARQYRERADEYHLAVKRLQLP